MTRPLLIALALLAASSHAAELPRANAPCDQAADPTRWAMVGTPDAGATPALISSHRGANLLAPENTLWAFRHAFAYESDFIEVDVRESADGVFYCLHDSTVDRTTGGTGELAGMTSLQIDALNAADFEPWIGSEYDPSPVPRLEDILELAKAAGKGIRPENTLAALYLEPLKARIAENDGCVQKDCAPFHILIDAKTEGETTYAAIEAELAKYDALFTKYENGGLRPGAVTATLSGNRPLATMKAAMSHYTFYDGRFSDLDSAEPVTLMPLISDSWTTHFGWDGSGPMPADQKAQLIDAITKSHARGRRVRLYNVPDAAGAARANIWKELLAANQDQINTDDLAGLRAFLLANDPKQR